MAKEPWSLLDKPLIHGSCHYWSNESCKGAAQGNRGRWQPRLKVRFRKDQRDIDSSPAYHFNSMNFTSKLVLLPYSYAKPVWADFRSGYRTQALAKLLQKDRLMERQVWEWESEAWSGSVLATNTHLGEFLSLLLVERPTGHSILDTECEKSFK